MDLCAGEYLPQVAQRIVQVVLNESSVVPVSWGLLTIFNLTVCGNSNTKEHCVVETLACACKDNFLKLITVGPGSVLVHHVYVSYAKISIT